MLNLLLKAKPSINTINATIKANAKILLTIVLLAQHYCDSHSTSATLVFAFGLHLNSSARIFQMLQQLQTHA